MTKDKKLYALTFLGLEGPPEDSEAIITHVSPLEQVLEVSAGPGARPYYIVGKRETEEGVFTGKHFGPKGDPRVVVRWLTNEMGTMGVWVEDESFFSFAGSLSADLIPYGGTE